MPATLRAVRGATTVDEDTPEAITGRVVALLGAIMERNALVEDDIVSILFTATEDLVSVLSLLVRQVVASAQRLGPVVFREMLGLHFSANRPGEDDVSEHPLAEFVIAAITSAQQSGRVPAEADAAELGVFFLTGLFALLATGAHASAPADAVMDRYVSTIVKGMETR